MTVWFDPDAALAAADGWSEWGNSLDVSARSMRLEAASVAMAGWVDGGDLAAAAVELWTSSAFTHALRGAVARADGSFPTGAGGAAALWDASQARVDQSVGYRDTAADRAALEQWLRRADDDEAREYLEARFGGSTPTEALAGIPGHLAALYWDTLSGDERADLIYARPDLVVLQVVTNGGALTPWEVRSLDTANSYEVFTDELALEFDASAGLRVITVDIGGGVTLVTTKNSDGTVDITFVEELSAGVSAAANVPRAVDAAAGAGVFGEAQQKFRFADESAALAAMATLRDAVAEDASFGELAKDLGGIGWNVSSAPARGGIWLTNTVIPIWDPVPQIPTYDLTPHTIHRLRDLWASNGLVRQEGIGAYAGVSAEFEANLGAIEAELDGSVEARLLFYDSDAAAAALDQSGQTGVLFSGVASIDVDAEIDGLDHDTGGHAAAEAGFLLDLYQVDDDGTYFTLTLSTSVAAGASMELLDLGAAEIDLTHDRTAAMTVAITVPVTGETTEAVARAGGSLAIGQMPVAELRELYDVAAVDVMITTGSSTTGEFEFDGGVVEVNASATSSQSETEIALRKFPGGRLYDVGAVNALIDEAAS